MQVGLARKDPIPATDLKSDLGRVWFKSSRVNVGYERVLTCWERILT
jgi:hypothetical protein